MLEIFAVAEYLSPAHLNKMGFYSLERVNVKSWSFCAQLLQHSKLPGKTKYFEVLKAEFS